MKLKLREKLHSLFGFRTLPVTVFLLLCYCAVGALIWVDNWLPVPPEEGGAELDRAYMDWHRIAARPHPYNSQANNDVRAYIHSRFKSLALVHEHVVLSDDISDIAFVRSSTGVYFEGSNILVKVSGTSESEEELLNNGTSSKAILLSASYTSPSISPGVSDSLGVVALIQLVEHFATQRPQRSLVFMFGNDGEGGESARSFLNHPWSNTTDTFISLASGISSRVPTITRATSTIPLIPLRATRIPHMHANPLPYFLGNFSLQHNLSTTTYDMYAKSMEGFELSLPQSSYVRGTKYDSIPFIDQPRRVLWNVIEVTQGVVRALADSDIAESMGDEAVYFDIFSFTLVIQLRTLLTINIVLLTLGPLLLLLLAAIKHFTKHEDRVNRDAPSHHHHRDNRSIRKRVIRKLNIAWMRVKFWVAVASAVGAQGLLGLGFVKLNPYAYYASPTLTLLAAGMLSLFTLVLVLRFPPSPMAEKQKHTVLMFTYILTWVVLLLFTICPQLCLLTYTFTIWNILLLTACLIGYIELAILARHERIKDEEGDRVVRFQEALDDIDEDIAIDTGSVFEHERDGEREAATERTPLILRPALVHRKEHGEEGVCGLWILQVLLVVPVPVFLVERLVGAVQPEGNPMILYASVSCIALLLTLPVAPFSLKVHRGVLCVAWLACALSTVYLYMAFPFSPETPMGVTLVQRIALDDTSQPLQTSLTGPPYINRTVSHLPSTMGKEVHCSDTTCTWEGLMPSHGGSSSESWVGVKIDKMNDTAGTRACWISFARGIEAFNVLGFDVGFHTEEGINKIELWGRLSGRFVLDVSFSEGSLEGRVGCVWVEHETGMVGSGEVIDGEARTKAPALEEALLFLPKWSVVSDAYVDASVGFSI
ncbi:hypothetical protein BDQ17DRAFT_1374881 [Cyathus striatus]|nr:hypothetical protein BDQ17DRAFT_1374881 [Cyathus striatus]